MNLKLLTLNDINEIAKLGQIKKEKLFSECHSRMNHKITSGDVRIILDAFDDYFKVIKIRK
jgi:hypothetical protein